MGGSKARGPGPSKLAWLVGDETLADATLVLVPHTISEPGRLWCFRHSAVYTSEAHSGSGDHCAGSADSGDQDGPGGGAAHANEQPASTCTSSHVAATKQPTGGSEPEQ
jgi:hypothetical protein